MPRIDGIGFAPPLTLTRAEADQIVDIAHSATQEIAATL